MRHFFFMALAGSLGVAIASWAIYMFGRALLQVFDDWRLGRELDVLQQEGAARRRQRVQSQSQRLATGCDHDFAGGAIGLPANVCSRCGMEKEKPVGQCDHLWRVKPGPVPSSECEKCGKTYHPLQPTHDPTSR